MFQYKLPCNITISLISCSSHTQQDDYLQVLKTGWPPNSVKRLTEKRTVCVLQQVSVFRINILPCMPPLVGVSWHSINALRDTWVMGLLVTNQCDFSQLKQYRRKECSCWNVFLFRGLQYISRSTNGPECLQTLLSIHNNMSLGL